jgi:hypothetical protein
LKNTSAEAITRSLSDTPKKIRALKLFSLQQLRQLEAVCREQSFDLRELNAPFVLFQQDRIHQGEKALLDPKEIHL